MEQEPDSSREIVWTSERTKRLWDFYSKKLAGNQYFSYHSGHYILKFINRYLNIWNMESILDFGCGPGYLLDHLLKFKGLKGKLYALEFSKESIHQVNMKFSNHPHFGRAEYIQNLPCSFEDHSMDVVISIEVVEHLTDGQLRGTFKEFYRMLKPGGYAVITTPHNENLDLNKTICPECGLVFHRWQHIKTWTPQSLKNILSESGFKIELVQATYFQSARARWLNRILRIGTLSFKRPDSQLPHLIAIVKKNA